MNGAIFAKPIIINHYQVQVALMKFSRSRFQRPRSSGDGHIP